MLELLLLLFDSLFVFIIYIQKLHLKFINIILKVIHNIKKNGYKLFMYTYIKEYHIKITLVIRKDFYIL